MLNPWYTFKFYIGLLTTALVAKPLATAFGGTVTVVGMGIAYFNYARHKREEHLPVAVTHSEEHLPGSTLAVLMPESETTMQLFTQQSIMPAGSQSYFSISAAGIPGERRACLSSMTRTTTMSKRKRPLAEPSTWLRSPK